MSGTHACEWSIMVLHVCATEMNRRGLKQYKYTRDLLEMEGRESGMSLSQVPAELQQVQTLLQIKEWEKSLRAHPDREFCDYLLRGMRSGFRVGFHYAHSSSWRVKSNKKSALENAEVVDEYLANELVLGRVIGPLEPALLPAVSGQSFWHDPKEPPARQVVIDC